jgi:hypothetical protein
LKFTCWSLFDWNLFEYNSRMTFIIVEARGWIMRGKKLTMHLSESVYVHITFASATLGTNYMRIYLVSHSSPSYLARPGLCNMVCLLLKLSVEKNAGDIIILIHP